MEKEPLKKHPPLKKRPRVHMDVPDVPTRNVSISFYEGFCNLACPKCPAFGEEFIKNRTNFMKGTMKLEDATKLFEELKDKGASIAGGGYTEPLLQKCFFDYVDEMHKRNIKVNINTNGLLITTKKRAERLVSAPGVSSIFISIDAISKEALIKTRATDKLEKIHKSVFLLLEARGDSLQPRIGVSFSEEEGINEHEREPFIDYWIKHVDAIRVNKLYAKAEYLQIEATAKPEVRKPCSMLYDSMLVHYNGDVSICCLDANGETNLGNVFKDGGIKAVWKGEKFQQIREYHETGQFDKVPFCKNCDDWKRYHFTSEEVKGNIQIRKSPLMMYYNRIDRMGNWKPAGYMKVRPKTEGEPSL